MMSRCLPLIALLVCVVPVTAAMAEQPSPESLDPSRVVERLGDMPARGATKDAVQERLGDPVRRLPAVGDPPIARWVYPRFTVYFEHDRVLHSVKRHDR